MKLFKIAAVVAACSSFFSHAYQTEDTRILRFADIHKDNVTFVYAGDIYIANHKNGSKSAFN